MRGFLIAVALSFVATAMAAGFDDKGYQTTDLDNIIEQALPGTVADLSRTVPLRIRATLTSYAEPCDTNPLKRAMTKMGVPEPPVDWATVISCIKVRSAKGRVQALFINSHVAESLRQQISLECPLTVAVIHLYTDPDGPGLMVYPGDRVE